MISSHLSSLAHRLVSTGISLVMGVWGLALLPQPARSAERITTFLGPLQLTVSLDALETFVEEGTASGTLALMLRAVNEPTRAQLRQGLGRSLTVNAETVARITYVPMVEQVLQSAGRAFTMPSGRNGFSGLRSALILTAANQPEGWTAIDVLRQFPGDEVRVDLRYLQAIARELSAVLVHRDAAVEVIRQAAQQEASAQPLPASALADLSQPGPYTYRRERLSFDIRATRATLQGLATRYTLRADAYLPEGVSGPVPVVVFSHGFGGRLTDGATVADHLTSHGFAVLVPEHIGTTDTFRSNFLQGRSGDIMSPIEYVSRQLDIIYMLDEFEALAERDPDWANLLDLQRVGVIGASFGGLTTISAAGASFNPAQFDAACADGLTQFNPSFLLQCHARFLPPTEYAFTDPRIRAAFAQYPMGATLYGPAGMANIEIPTLILAGSHDLLAPSVYEQIPMFAWMNSPDKYLAMMVPGNHFSTSSPSNLELVPRALHGPDASIGRAYQRSLSVAFFGTYLSENPDASPYRPYLTAAYADRISQPEMPIYVVRSLPADQLNAAYGGSFPAAVTATAASTTPASVLEDIQQTGLLRVGIRTDSAPLGSIDREGRWDGYCFDLATALAQHLSRSGGSGDRPLGLDVIQLPSNASTRADLVQSGAVHLECGPNVIEESERGVVFSEPFMVSGTQVLVSAATAEAVNLNQGLSGLAVGVVDDRTAANLQQRYPQAEIRVAEDFDLQALLNGSLDAVADDGLRLLGEVARGGESPTAFALVPATPLSCNFYGLLLPAGDRPWQTTVNRFLRSDAALQARRDWLGDFSNNALATLDFCFR